MDSTAGYGQTASKHRWVPGWLHVTSIDCYSYCDVVPGDTSICIATTAVAVGYHDCCSYGPLSLLWVATGVDGGVINMVHHQFWHLCVWYAPVCAGHETLMHYQCLPCVCYFPPVCDRRTRMLWRLLLQLRTGSGHQQGPSSLAMHPAAWMHCCLATWPSTGIHQLQHPY